MSDVVRSVRVAFDASGVVRSLSSQETSAKSAADKMSALASENARAISSYDKLRATLDPTTAAHLKYSAAARTLDDSLRRGIATQSEHAALLAAAKSKYLDAGEGASKFSQLLSGVDKLTGAVGGSVREMGEGLDFVKGKFEAVSGAIEGLGALAPVIGAVAGAVILLAAGFKAFELLKDIISDGIKTQAVYNQLEATLRANGAAAGYSSHQLIENAEALVNVTGVSKDLIVQGEGILTRFQRIGHDVFPIATKAALDYARLTGKAIPEAFTIIGEVYDGNVRKIRTLQDAGVTLSAKQRQTMQEMVDNGRILEYQGQLTDILKGHLEGVAKEYAEGLGGSLDIARSKLDLFKESISNEVIPTLQRLFNAQINAAGGWDEIDKNVKSKGASVGTAINYIVTGALLLYNEWEYETDKLNISIESGFRSIATHILDTADLILRSVRALPSAFGGGEGWTSSIKAIEQYRASIEKSAKDNIANYEKDARAHDAANARIIAGLATHDKALEGSNTVLGKHGRAEDEVAAKIKGHADALISIQQVFDAYNNKLLDISNKQQQSLQHQSALAQAARIGSAAYEEERQVQERLAAVEAKENEVRVIARDTIQKLTADVKKANEAHDPSAAAKAQSDLDKIKGSYENAATAAGKLAGQIYDAGLAAKNSIVDNRTYDQLVAKIAADEARLTDAFVGNTDASTRNAIQADLTRLKIELGKKSVDELSKSLVDNVTRLHETEKAFKELEPAVKAITDLEHDVQFNIAVSKIDTSVGAAAQAIEVRYLDMLRTMGQGSIDRGSEVLRTIANKFGITVEELIARLKGDIAKLEEIQFASQFRGLGQSDLSKFDDEISRIKQAMADGVLSVADGTAAIAKKSEEFWTNELGLWSSGLSYIAQHTGSFFQELADFVNKLQSAQSGASSIAGLASSFGAKGSYGGLGGSSSGLVGGIGVAAAEFGIVLAVVDTIEGIWEKHNLKKLGPLASLIISDTQEGVTALDKNGIAAVAAIRKTVGDFAAALGGIVSDIPAIGIRVRNDGKAVAAYVAGQFIGYFADINSAVQAALLNALTSGNSVIRNLPALVAQGLNQFRGLTGQGLDDLLSFEEKLKQISQLTFSDGAVQVTDTIAKMNDLWATLAKFTTVTPEVTQGFIDIGNTVVNSFASWRRSITGEEQSPAELLAQREAEAKLFNAKKALEIASLEAQELDLKAQQQYLEGKKGGYAGDAELSKSDLHAKKAYLEAKGSILTAEVGLTNQAISIQIAQINAIEQEIEALKAIPDIDLTKIHLPKTGHPGGVSTSSADDVRNALEQARIARLGEEGQALANINARWDEELKKAGKSADLIAQVTRARQAEIDALSKQARTQYLTPYLGGQFSGDRTDYAKQLRDAAAAESDLTANAGPLKLALTDISDAFREQGRELGLQVLSDIGDTTASLTLQYEKTGQAIDFLKSHMADLSLTAEQVAASLSQLSSRTELSIFGGIQQYITDETTIAKYKEIQYELDIADAKTKLALAYESNALSLEAYNRIGAILYGLPDTAPASTLQGSATSAAQSQITAADTQLQAAQTAKDAAEKLTQWQHSLMTNPETSPLAPRAQLARSKSDLDTVIAKALAGDTAAKDKFTSVADDYLKLFVSTLGRTGAYAAEALRLSGVADVLKTVLPNNPAQNVVLFPGYSPSGVGTPTLTNSGGGSHLGTPPPPPIPSGTHRLPTDADPRVIDHLTSVDDRLGPNSDLLKSIKAAGADAATHHARVIPIYNAQTAHLQNIADTVGKVQSYLERVLEQLRTRKTGTDG